MTLDIFRVIVNGATFLGPQTILTNSSERNNRSAILIKKSVKLFVYFIALIITILSLDFMFVNIKK